MAEAKDVPSAGPAILAAAASKRAKALTASPEEASRLIKQAEALEASVARLDAIEASEGIPSKSDIMEAVLSSSRGPGALEQSMAISNVDDVKLPVKGLPDRQAVSMETAKYSQGLLDILAMLLPFLALAGSVWQTLGGLGQLFSMFDKLTGASGTDDGTSKKAGDATAAIKAAVEAAGYTQEDLKDPVKAMKIAALVEMPPIDGLSSTSMKLTDFLDRVTPVMPCVAVPNDPNQQNTTPQTSGTKEIIQSVPKKITGLVDSSAETPPDCTLVNTNQFRGDSDIFRAIGNPAAALQEDIALARDLNNVAGLHNNLADTMTDIGSAADSFAHSAYAESLRFSVRAMLKGLVTFNFQMDETCSFAGTTPRSLKWWNTFLPPPQILDTAIMDKIANGEELSPTEVSDYNTAITDMTTDVNLAVSALTRFGAMPGTMVYAAIGDDPYNGTLDQLVDAIPSLIATREGIDGGGVSTIQSVIFDLGQPDARVLEIPTILMGADPAIQTNTPAVKRWISTLQYIKALTTAEVAQLSLLAVDISTASLLFINQVKASTLDLGSLYISLLRHTLSFDQQLALKEISDAWDVLNSVLFIDPNQQAPGAVVFLTELLAARPLLGISTMTGAIASLASATLSIGGPLGTDLAQLCGVVGALLRIDTLLASLSVTDILKESRTKDILGFADEMAKPVTHLPNPDIFKNIAEVI